jgi:6-phosphogluconate dehydrogenase
MTDAAMTIGMVGLGRMGANMTQRLIGRGQRVIAYDSNTDTVAAVAAHGAEGSASLEDLVGRLDRPRSVWVMVPSGDATNDTIDALWHLLSPGDTVIDGGNSHYRNAQRWSTELRERGIDLVDAGVSGGVWGLEHGYCLMVGGRPDAVGRLEPILKALAPEDGFAYVGPSGAGHYAKMIHNGVEYGLLQAYAEGFALLDAARGCSCRSGHARRARTAWPPGEPAGRRGCPWRRRRPGGRGWVATRHRRAVRWC